MRINQHPPRKRFQNSKAMAAVAMIVPLVLPIDSLRGDEVQDNPLGQQLEILSHDLTSSDYREVLETMISNDLAAEWLRVGTPDNYLTFLNQHGGREKVFADPKLKAAYEKRHQIAENFLELMRTAYGKRKLRVPFNDAQVQELLERAVEKQVRTSEQANIPVRVVMPAPGAQEQWPRFRGPTGQGEAASSDFPSTWNERENIVWKTELPGEGNSSPVIWDDKIFVTAATKDGRERLLLCYSRTDGRLLWKQTAPTPATQEKLYWKNTYASSTAVTDGERVIVFFGNSGLFCFDFSGQLLWQKDLGPFLTMHGPGTSPLIYQDKVIFIQYQNRGDSLFVAFDKRTGQELWRRKPENQMCWTTPVVLRVGDHDELVYNGSLRVAGYNPDTGEELWHVNGSTQEAIPTIVIGGGLIYSTSGRNGPTLAIRPGAQGDATATHLFWQTQRGGSHVPSPAYHDGLLFLVSDTGIAKCLDATNGKSVWQKRLRGRFSMSPLKAGETLILTNEEGKSYLLKAGNQFELLAENDLGEETLATPALFGGRIYFRTARHLICVGTESGVGTANGKTASD